MKNLLSLIIISTLIFSCKKDNIERHLFTIEISNASACKFEGSILNADGAVIKSYSGNNKYITEEISMIKQDYMMISFAINNGDITMDSAANGFWIKIHDISGSVSRHLMYAPFIDSVSYAPSLKLIIDNKIPY